MTAENEYTIGYGEGAVAFMRLRTAERCCAFFREYVQPDSRILDCGCGPGSITVGLAQWAPDGETVGIDIGAEQLESARALARELDRGNVTFGRGDIFALPFEDDSFDIVFSQTVFFHIPNHHKALAEVKRVLRPGGLVALRDAINSSLIVWPEDPLVREMYRMLRLGALHSGGSPDVGQEFGTLLAAAGFEDVFLTLAFQSGERPDERAAYLAGVAGGIEGDLMALAVSQGWATADTLARGAARLREFASQPGSIAAMAFGQAIGRKPG